MLRKLLWSRKAFTLLEVLLSIAIVAAIALPLLSLFLSAAENNMMAKGVLSANYISQDYIEKLDTAIYKDALQAQPEREERDGYYLTAKITPYGNASSLFPSGCGYAHLLFYESGSMLAVMPDGQWKVFTSVPLSISLAVSGGVYAFSAGSVTLTGSAGSTKCALVVNAAKKPSGTTSTITLGTNCKALRYCEKLDKADITIVGTEETYYKAFAGEESLIYVKAYVYETADDTKPVATTEGYVKIKNW